MKTNKLDFWLMTQLVLVIILVVILLLSFFFKFLLPYAEIVAGLALMVMGYNNQRIYKRKLMTIVYVIFGIIIIAIYSTGIK